MKQTKTAGFPAPSVGKASGGAPGSESFVTVNDETATLPQSRQLAAGAGIAVTDGGAGNPITVDNTLPENTSVANVGVGEGDVVRGMSGDQIDIKTIKAGINISISNHADDIEISNPSPENTSVANAGDGAGQVFKDMTGDQINLKTIKAGANTVITNNTDDVTIAGTEAFAEIYVADGATPQNIPTGAAYEKLTGFATNGASSNCTADAANDKITITRAGFYKVSAQISFTSDTNNVVYRVAAFYDGVEQDQCHFLRKLATGADAGSASFVGIIDCAAGKDIDLRCRHDNGGTVALTPVYMQLVVEYLGET